MNRSRRILVLSALAQGAVALRVPLAAQTGGEKGFPYGDLKEVTLQGSFIDLRDQMARKYGAKIGAARTGSGERQWAFAGPEGQLYTFLDTPASRAILAAMPAPEAVEIKARQFPRSSILELLSFKALPAHAVKRRFYCNVCAIYADDWGPCVCCGQEMKIVPEAR